MKSKKGFVFVETIVVCAVLATSLVTIYAAFVLLVNDQKKRNKYDQALYNYRLYNVAKELNDTLEVGCSTNYEEIAYTNKNKLDINSLYYIKINNLKIGVPSEHHLDEYVKTINTENLDDSCILIGEFKKYNPNNKKDEYYYSSVIIESKG